MGDKVNQRVTEVLEEFNTQYNDELDGNVDHQIALYEKAHGPCDEETKNKVRNNAYRYFAQKR